MSKSNAAHLTSHSHLIELFVALITHGKLKNMVAKMVELVLIKAAPNCIISEEPEEECPFVLIVPLLGAKGKRQVGSAIELGMHPTVAFVAQGDAVASLKGSQRIERLPDDVVSLNSFARITAYAPIQIPGSDELAPQPENPVACAALLYSRHESQFPLPDFLQS
ncbi:MAG: hypothetical protein QM739_08115 [Propionivibrio sp.]